MFSRVEKVSVDRELGEITDTKNESQNSKKRDVVVKSKLVQEKDGRNDQRNGKSSEKEHKMAIPSISSSSGKNQ